MGPALGDSTRIARGIIVARASGGATASGTVSPSWEEYPAARWSAGYGSLRSSGGSSRGPSPETPVVKLIELAFEGGPKRNERRKVLETELQDATLKAAEFAANIAEVKADISEVKAKLAEVEAKIAEAGSKADRKRLEKRLGILEVRAAGLDTKAGALQTNLTSFVQGALGAEKEVKRLRGELDSMLPAKGTERTRSFRHFNF